MQKLIKQLSKDYPDLQITAGERYQFSPPNHLYYVPDDADHSPAEAKLLLLHELGHYLTGEYDYASDIELLEIEAKAWAHARDLCSKYRLDYDEDFAEDRLDSYRDYLHYASLCPDCQLAGYQDKTGKYHCPLCAKTWHRKYSIE